MDALRLARVLLLCSVALGFCWVARAADGSDASYRDALRAEKERDYVTMLSLCADVIAKTPQSVSAERCQRKTAALSRRRDRDGTFSNWSQLEAVRAAFQTMDGEQRHRRVTAIWRSETASDAVRIEAALWLARNRLDSNDPGAALSYTEPLLAISIAEEPALMERLRQQHAVVLAALGRSEEALALQANVSVPTAPGAERPTPVDLVLIERRYRALSQVAGALLVSFVLPALLFVLWRARTGALSLAGFVPLGLWPLGIAVVGAYGIAESWERSAGRALPIMGLGFAVLHLLSAAALRAAEGSPLSLLLVRAGAAAATLSVAWLALWSTDTIDWVLRW